jgi:O-acetylserine/cysteine efflux transporter
MKITDILLLLLTMVIWGVNFVAIKLGLRYMPPFTLTAARFLLVVFPAIFFVKKPDIPLRKLAIYGLVMFAAQFTCMFFSIHAGLSAGLASLVMQIQAFFTIGFAMLIFKEKPQLFQLVGAAVAFCGIGVVGMHIGGEVTWLGLMFAMMACMCWGAGNLMTKGFGKVSAFPVIIWGSLFAAIPMVILALIFDRNELHLSNFTNPQLPLLFAVGYNAYVSTFIAYTIWSRMLARYPAALVAPFTLLVPVFGMASTAVFLDETYYMWKFTATLLILLGLLVNQFGGKAKSWLNTRLKFAPAPD